MNAAKKNCSASYWHPPVPVWKAPSKPANPGPVIACIVGERLYQGLVFEGQVILLTSSNWQHSIIYGAPDFLLIDSMVTAGAAMVGGATPLPPSQDEVYNILHLCRRRTIPTVLWITEGHEGHEHVRDWARHFDFVFCADPIEAECLRGERIDAEVLLPCVQPAVNNPYRLYKYEKAISLNVLYDGWADLGLLSDTQRVLKALPPHRLSIIESRSDFSQKRLEWIPELMEFTLGRVTHHGRTMALKYAKSYITFDKTASSRTIQSWMSLEAVASHLPVVHHGILAADDLRHGIVIECPDETDFVLELRRFCEERWYRLEEVHSGWRSVLQQHTYAHRVKAICSRLGLSHNWSQWPMLSMISVPVDARQAEDCCQRFLESNYPHKELFIVHSGEHLPSKLEDICKNHNDVHLHQIPKELSDKDRLLHAIHSVGGRYALIANNHKELNFKDYLSDMVMNARTINADLFGGTSPYVLHQKSGNSYHSFAYFDFKESLQAPAKHHRMIKNDQCNKLEDLLVSQQISDYSSQQNILLDISRIRHNPTRLHFWVDYSTNRLSWREATARIIERPNVDMQFSVQSCIERASTPALWTKRVVKRPKVSVIIPAYNKAEFIASCLDSVVNNGYENVEIICIDDHSTDATVSIASDYARSDTRIRLLSNSTNHGAGRVRNLGISIASGKYLFFLDADDKLADMALPEMVAVAEDTGCDLVRGKITGFKSDGSRYRLAAEHLLHDRNITRTQWRNEESLWYYWYFTANLYSRQFINTNRITFPNGLRNEDPFFLARCFLAAEKISLHNKVVYYYFVGPEQRKKTPSYSFLNGWSLGNYYLHQLISTQYIQTQYFLIHFPSLLNHSINAVKNLHKAQSYHILKYLQLMFKKIDVCFLRNKETQPWKRKRSFPAEDVDYVQVLKSKTIEDIYDYLIKYSNAQG